MVVRPVLPVLSSRSSRLGEVSMLSSYELDMIRQLRDAVECGDDLQMPELIAGVAQLCRVVSDLGDEVLAQQSRIEFLEQEEARRAAEDQARHNLVAGDRESRRIRVR